MIGTQLDDHGLVVLAVHAAHGIGDFADGPVGFDGLDDYRHQVAGAARGIFDGLERGLALRRITLGTHRAQALDLLALQRLIHVQQRDRLFVLEFKRVHANHDGFVTIHSLLINVRSILDFLLDEASFDGLQRATHGVNLVEVGTSASLNLVGQRFDVIRAGKWIDGLRRAGLVGDDLLSAQSDAG